MLLQKEQTKLSKQCTKLIKVDATKTKAFLMQFIKQKDCEINSNQKLIKADAIGAAKECLITFIEPKKHGCQVKRNQPHSVFE